MLPSPAELTYFVEVAATLNISRAAERLGISQPSLSLAIKRLEDGLGVALLVRSKSGVSLTRTGRSFAAQARRLLQEWEKLRDEALKGETELSGRYVVGCHPSVALYTLPQVLPALLSAHPALEISLLHGLSRQVTDAVIGFRADFGLVVNPVEHPELVIKLLERDEVGLWVGPGKAKTQDPASPDAVLICDEDLLQTQELHKQLRKKGWNFRRTVQASNLEVITELVAAGAGIGLLPGRVATRDPARKLKMIAGSPTVQDRICLAFRPDAQKSAASKLLAQALAACLSG
jgi:DNA-binding transcriptional LysR family regulator